MKKSRASKPLSLLLYGVFVFSLMGCAEDKIIRKYTEETANNIADVNKAVNNFASEAKNLETEYANAIATFQGGVGDRNDVVKVKAAYTTALGDQKKQDFSRPSVTLK